VYLYMTISLHGSLRHTSLTMADPTPQRPHIDEVPGMWPSTSANSFREQYLAPGHLRASHVPESPNDGAEQLPATSHSSATAVDPSTPQATEGTTQLPIEASDQPTQSALYPADDVSPGDRPLSAAEIETEPPSEDEVDERGGFAPIKTGPTGDKSNRPGLAPKASSRTTGEDLFKALSRKRTNTSSRQGSYISPQVSHSQDELVEIERLLSRMFGKNRLEQSEEEKTRHVGLVFRDLTVKGLGLGAALQPTLGDLFLNLPRALAGLFGKNKVSHKVPVRTIINKFTGCVRPGEMLLVLGRPGSGCSTFLKVLANQRFGYEKIDGDVTYGGTDAKTMGKRFRGEVVYNPEDDLHYATLSVKNTFDFALKTRTPGKASRNEGESRNDYRQEFLKVVAKLFWIEHTLGTKVGDEFVRGVSGGEKKRVSIAEAMITKASIQCWDNSTKGLDASTALEYVQSLRSLTNMANISTSVALYQAGESLYDLFDKVVLIDEGRCLYYGPTEDAAAYFENLGFSRPARWTTADFLTSVTDEHEREIMPGYKDRIPRSAEQFEDAYRDSEVYKANVMDIEDFEKEIEQQRKERLDSQTKATKEKNYTLPFYKQVTACTHRQFLIMFGDQQSLVGKWGGILFQALIVGSLFYNMPRNSAGVFTRGGVLFFMLLFNALLALAELTSAFASRPIMLKHKSL